MVWVEPKTWRVGENLNVEKLNTQIRDNQNHLLSRPRHVITQRNLSSNIVVTGLAVSPPVAIDDSLYTLEIPLAATRIKVWMLAHVTSDSGGASQDRGPAFDFLLNDSTFLSSGTATAVTRGLAAVTTKSTASTRQTLSFDGIFSDITPGNITLKWRWKAWGAAVNATIVRIDSFLQIGVMEI